MADVDGTVISGLGPAGTGDGQYELIAANGTALKLGAPVASSGVSYRMRGYDTTLARYVYWSSSTIDSGAASYAGPGPVLDIVVQAVLGAG